MSFAMVIDALLQVLNGKRNGDDSNNGDLEERPDTVEV